MYVLTINQRDSREAGDMVDELIRRLRTVDALLPFQRSVGDELIGVVADPHVAVDVALTALRQRRWNVGLGVGPVHTVDGTAGLPDSGRVEDVAGPGLAMARQAVEAAAHGQRIPVAVSARNVQAAAEAEAVLRLIGQLVWTRTAAEWRVLDLMVPGVRGQQKLVAAELGITTQAVSQAVQRAFWTEEHACRPAAARLLALAEEAGAPDAG